MIEKIFKIYDDEEAAIKNFSNWTRIALGGCKWTGLTWQYMSTWMLVIPIKEFINVYLEGYFLGLFWPDAFLVARHALWSYG
jgi:hypothetical protein